MTLTKSFYMGKYEVTQEQWELVMKNNPSTEKGRNLPVTDVSWEDTQTFCEKLNTISNKTFRLPSEAEWEYSCRAHTKFSYHFGETLTPANANYVDSKHGTPIKVGSYKPNGFGLYDMHGNVWEWCNDFLANIQKAKRSIQKAQKMANLEQSEAGVLMLSLGCVRLFAISHHQPIKPKALASAWL